MIRRLFFALKMGWRYRQSLRVFQRNPGLQCQSILSLDLYPLKSSGIKVLAIDFDGVLACHGEDILSNPMEHWLKACTELFSGKDSLFILSNRPTLVRQRFFSQRFPTIQWISGVRKKPYPDGILQILDKTKVSPSSVLVIDDRLLTGILAAVIAGTQARWITKPVISIQKRPVQELFFIFLRFFERCILR